MAKQVGPVFITGTLGDICFYKLDGVYCARKKSSLSGKRVKKDPKFRRTMEYAGLMAQASKIASRVYRLLPRDKREHALYREMTGEALRLLRDGVEADVVEARLREEYVLPKMPVAEAMPVVAPAPKVLSVEASGGQLQPCYRLCVTNEGLLATQPPPLHVIMWKRYGT